MPDWTKVLARLGTDLDSALDAMTRRMRARTGTAHCFQVLPYRTYGTDQRLWIKGRVLKEGPKPALGTDRLWHNVLATYRRLNSTELPGARLRISYASQSLEVTANNEGFFDAELENIDLDSSRSWQQVDCTLLNPLPPGQECGQVQAQVLVPSPSATLGVISDVDDTIIVTNARYLLKMAYATFARSARGRVAFPGVAALYHGLQNGPDGAAQNPIFYVSSGPWNLYDLLTDFMQLNGIPIGPIILQDYGFEEGIFLKASHGQHKGPAIERILQTYPDLPFVLIGDSGQKDPEIYAEVLRHVPNRIRAIYIRHVADDLRQEQVARLAAEAEKHGGSLLLVKDSLEAAEDAFRRGLLNAEAVEAVRAQCLKQKQTADPAQS